MRDALDAFMTTVADIADAFAQRSQDEGDLVSASVRKHGTIVLGLGGWPLAIGGTDVSDRDRARSDDQPGAATQRAGRP